MARRATHKTEIIATKKNTSQGLGGRGGRKVRIGMSSMNKSKKRSFKKYRGQGK